MTVREAREAFVHSHAINGLRSLHMISPELGLDPRKETATSSVEVQRVKQC
jgi:hypothetical protein